MNKTYLVNARSSQLVGFFKYHKKTHGALKYQIKESKQQQKVQEEGNKNLWITECFI